MNFARHLLQRAAAAIVRPMARPVVFPPSAPLRIASTPIPRIPQILPRLQPQKRHESTAIGSLTSDPDPSSKSRKNNKPGDVKPSYDLTFTCKPCGHRSTHNVSKQGYHYGSVLITCPGCHSRHVISDHLMIFGETARSFEDILDEAGKGEKIRNELSAAEETLRSRGVWSEDGTHVEVLPEGAVAKPTEESWELGLDSGGRNFYPDPEAEPEVESTGEVDGAKVVNDGVVEGAGRKQDI